jgi:hypothetical protein
VRQAEPDTREADLAIEREKKRLEKERKEREQLQERQRLEKERKEQERKAQELKDKEKQREKEHRRKSAKKRQAPDRRKETKGSRSQAQAGGHREGQCPGRRGPAPGKPAPHARLAGATGENATGTAQRDAGPSGGYGGRVAAKVKPHIVYPDAVAATRAPRSRCAPRPTAPSPAPGWFSPAATRPGTTPCCAPCKDRNPAARRGWPRALGAGHRLPAQRLTDRSSDPFAAGCSHAAVHGPEHLTDNHAP